MKDQGIRSVENPTFSTCERKRSRHAPAFSIRLKGEYDFEAIIDRATAEATIQQARESLKEANRHLTK